MAFSDADAAAVQARLEQLATAAEDGGADDALIRPRTIAWLIARGRNLFSRVGALEQSSLQLTVVPTLADLPAAAPATSLFRVAGDPNLYLGNGAGQPLRKIPTVVL